MVLPEADTPIMWVENLIRTTVNQQQISNFVYAVHMMRLLCCAGLMPLTMHAQLIEPTAACRSSSTTALVHRQSLGDHRGPKSLLTME